MEAPGGHGNNRRKRPNRGAAKDGLGVKELYPRTRAVVAWGFHSPYGSDGDDGDGQGSRFWGVRYVPQGEAPFSAPQAKKILA